MTWLAISIPIMVLALAIATVPVIVAMIAEQKLRTAQKAVPVPLAIGVTAAVVASALGAVAVGVALPGTARAAMAGSSVYVANTRSNTITSYPTNANGNASPTATLGSAQPAFSSPEGSAFDASGDLWVANEGNSTVVEFTPAQLAATGSATPAVTLSGAAGGNLDDPVGLAFDSAGDLWVTNEGNSTLVEFTRGQLAITGSPTPAVTLSATAGDSLDDPEGLAFDSAGDLWVTNEGASTVVEFTPAQLAITGSPTPAVTLSATAGDSLDDPEGLAFSFAGDLWVASLGNSTVVEFTPAQLAATGSPSPAVTLSAATGGSLDEPQGLAFDRAGDLWVTNLNSTVVEFTPIQLTVTGSPSPAATLSATTGNSLDGPYAIAFSSSGSLWVANIESNTVVEFASSQLAATGSPAPNVILGPSSGLGFPEGPAFSSSGNLWVANDDNNTVVEFTPGQLAATGSPTPAVTLSATPGFSLDFPLGMAFNAAGDLWVANHANNTVAEFTPAQLAATGSPTPAVTLNVAGTSLDGLAGLAFDPAGDLWLTSNLNKTVAEFTPGQLAATGSPTPAITLSVTGNGQNQPASLAFDAAGDLWVAAPGSPGTSTVVKFTPAQLTASGSPTPAVTYRPRAPAWTTQPAWPSTPPATCG